MGYPNGRYIRGLTTRSSVLQRPIVLAAALALLLSPLAPPSSAGPPFAEFIDPHPAPGNQFGATVVALSTGNVVITSPFDDAGGTDAGAVYLFNGATGALISTLIGSAPNDNVGSGGVTVLTNGNYVVKSPYWDSGAAADAGAVTWGSGVTGVSGVVSPSKSLVGSGADDAVGSLGSVTALLNGNYVVSSPAWDGSAADTGAVTWGNGTSGIVGVVSASNSVVGSTAYDRVGGDFFDVLPVTPLSNGNYVVSSPFWNGTAQYVGAVTWGNGVSGVVGVVSASNSLVGSTANDQVGRAGVTALTNGNYVIRSDSWDGIAPDVGAVTWGNGALGVVGAVSASNSLVGSTANDWVGDYGVTALTNGNYVVRSSDWDGAAPNVGAVTWGNGISGIVGVVSASNSLVGSAVDDAVGSGVTALTNGNYVVSSPGWDGSAPNAGAVTWGNGITGIVGVVSASNSLVGSRANDLVRGNFFEVPGVTPLTNGNYVVNSPYWDGTAPDVGAVTWGNGTSGAVGVLSGSNSLVGSTANDLVGSLGVTALTNGNYVVRSPHWDGTAPDVGAATWGNGISGIVGVVSASNSLVGSTANDVVGAAVTALTNGNYVVRSPEWDGAGLDVGAATWGNGISGIVGVVSVSNSLAGSTAYDHVGSGGVTALTNGNYVVNSPGWDGTPGNVGAVTWGNGASGFVGVLSASNSLMAAVHGLYDVTALTNGNYVVSSAGWDGTAGYAAATWGNGVSGTAGAVSASNSVMGVVSLLNVPRSIVVDDINGTFFARYLDEGGGKVRLGSQADGIAPTLGAVSSSNLTAVSADISGSVAVGSGLAITARGFVYAQTATNSAPTIGGIGVTQIRLGTGTGVISTTVSGLASLQGYSFRAYATNAAGTTYSATGTFTTGLQPTVASPSSSGITGTTATLGGNVISDEGSAITERGVVYSLTATNANPLIGGTGVSRVPVIGTTGLFATGVTGLSPTTDYSFRAFATSAMGTGYTSVATFATTCPTITLASLPNGNEGLAYAGSATASGGAGPYTYATTSGSLPGGLSLTASGAGAGNITGTPGVTGTFPFDITAIDTSGVGTCTGTQSYSVSIDPNPPTDFFTLTPCRLFDTRNAVDPLGGPALEALADRMFIVGGTCGIPADAKAISVNLAVTQPTNPGNIRLHAGGTPVPLVSSINFKAGQTRSNNGVIPLSPLGELAAYLDQVAGTAHLVLDVNGYFK